MTTKSTNGELTYTDGHALEECAVCREEHTDIREGDHLSSWGLLPICIYCANDRRPEYRPVAYLGAA